MSNLVRVDTGNGVFKNVIKGSTAHQNYVNSGQQGSSISYAQNAQNQKNNVTQQSNSQQSTQKPTQQQSYTAPKSTPSYSNSSNVKSLDSSGQSSFSVSGYGGASNPSFSVDSNTTNLLNQLRGQESLAKQTWDSKGEGYNDIWKERNNLSAQFLNSVLQNSGGNASLSEIESVLGRRLENQELESYRNTFGGKTGLQQTQLNNLFEHDFATRNNGEAYQYQMNYLSGDKEAPLAQSQMQYLDSLQGDARTKYLESMGTSLKATQDYFGNRSTGWSPDYMNNTVNPNPWGETDAFDAIENGNYQNNMNYQGWMEELMGLGAELPGQQMQQMPQQASQDDIFSQFLSQQQAQYEQQQAMIAQKLLEMEQQDAYKQSQITNQGGGQGLGGTVAPGATGTPSNSPSTGGYVDGQNVDSDALNRYLKGILGGGF